MSASLADLLRQAKVYDLEQPRYAGMPIHPAHRPGYFYALHRRHRDTYRPAEHGPRSSASGVLTMMEHSGTHLDALCHQAHELRLFGGVPVDGTETPAGFSRLGIGDVPGERDPETGATLFAHVYLLPQKGIYIIENVNLEELARDRRWEFAFLGIPLKLQGATGSPLRPLALA